MLEVQVVITRGRYFRVNKQINYSKNNKQKKF